MVTVLASRRAGRTLSLIVAALLLPIIVLGALYLRQASKEIRFLDRELIGVELATLVYRALLSKDHDSSVEDRIKIAQLESRLGVVRDNRFETHLEAAKAMVNAPYHAMSGKERAGGSGRDQSEASHVTENGTHHHESREALSAYLVEIGDISALILDGESVSYHLANAYMVQLPKLLDTHEQMVIRLGSNKSSGAHASISVSEAQQMFGRLSAHFESLKDEITLAARFAEGGVDFSSQQDALARLFETRSRINMSLGQLTFVGSALSEADKLAHATSLANTRILATAMVNDGLKLLGDRVQSRRDVLFRELLAFGTVGLASSLAALTLAAFLFRRTLTRLDEIEAMRHAAEFSRSETERVNGEVALLNRELSDKIKKLADAQNDIVRKGKMEQLGQLTATVAHELRNPLGAVRTSAFLIGKKTEGKALGIDAQLERINSGITRCDGIITQLLDYSRTRKISPQLADLDDWLATLVSNEASKLPPSIMVECTLGLGGAHVPFDGARLERAVLNLISNAVEAMLPNGSNGTPTRSPTLWISTATSGDFVTIRVKDNGPGIAAENLQRIREPLFTTKNFGTGLGIPAIEQIAEQHNGRLDIESLIGEGACFDLVIPRQISGEADAA
jgi:signal transduction histidine kinase